MEKPQQKKRYASDVGTPATKYIAVNINREEEENRAGGLDVNDANSLKPLGRLNADHPRLKTRDTPIWFGTWNVRTLYQAGKLDNAIREMEDMKLDVLGISETRWTKSGKIFKGDHMFIYSGGDKHEHGVGLMFSRKLARSLLGFWPVSDRIIMCKLSAQPFNLIIIQVYAPTTTHTDEEVETFYEDIQNCLKHAKSADVVIIMGDFNAIIGSNITSPCIGKHGLGTRNERGELLTHFCERNKLSVMNTLFKQPKRRLYTWKSPGDRVRNQIDYLLIKSRFKNNIITCKTRPGADIGSDHNPVVMKMKLKLKIPNPPRQRIKYDTDVLKDNDFSNLYSIEVSNMYEQLEIQKGSSELETEPEKIEKNWEALKTAIHKTNENMLQKTTKETKQEWMNKEILDLMKERKKRKGQPSYDELDKEIKNKCTEAKENWLNEKCSKIENLQRQHKTRAMFDEINLLTKTKQNTGTCITDADGSVLFEDEQVIRRWKEYVEDLFQDTRNTNPIQTYMTGPIIMKSEVRLAMAVMKGGKAPGIDGIDTEMLRALGDFGIETITELCNMMYQNTHIPEDLRTSMFILLPKKPNAVECSDHRTISLMCHVLKILLTIILRRIKDKINAEVGEEQAGFRNNSGTREAIFNLKILVERHLEVQKDVFACFIDYSKAFDSVIHEKLLETLKTIDVDDNDIALIAKLYWTQKTKIRHKNLISDPVKIEKGVRQGCVLSPCLFNLYTEHIFRELEQIPGLNVGGRIINNLRYADDTVLLATNERDLQKLVDKTKTISQEFGLKINAQKTKVMVFSRSHPKPQALITIDGRSVEQVQTFIYLGQMISDDGRSIKEVKRRIGIAKNTFNKMRSILTSMQISTATKVRLAKCYVWSTFLYACETWTITKEIARRIDALEMWIYRRILRISWTRKKSNVLVLIDAGQRTRKLLAEVKKRQLKYYGHIRRHESIQRLILEGKIAGKKARGKPRKSWMENVKATTGQKMNHCSRLALERGEWRSMVSNLCRETELR